MFSALASGLGTLGSYIAPYAGKLASATMAGAGASLANGVIGNFFGQQARQGAAALSYKNYRRQRNFDYEFNLTKGLDEARVYDAKNFDLARRYSENSASWARRGLENAGLNPILAANQGFNANLGSEGAGPSSSSGMPSMSSANPSFDVGGSISSLVGTFNSAKQVDANVDVAKATEKQIEANTLKTYIDAINDAGNGGINNWSTWLNRFMHDLGNGAHSSQQADALEDIGKMLGIDTRGDFDKAKDWLSKMFGQPPSVSKDVSRAKEVQKSWSSGDNDSGASSKFLSRLIKSVDSSREKMSPRMRHELRLDVPKNIKKHRHN